jgi:hypothetical protein
MRWRVDYNWETEHGCGFQDKGFDTQEQAREFIERIQQNEHKKITDIWLISIERIK